MGTSLTSTHRKVPSVPCARRVRSSPLYSHLRRLEDYSQHDYFDEFGVMVNAIHDSRKITRSNNIIAPSLQGTWSPESVWDTGYLDAYGSAISVLAMEQCVTVFLRRRYGVGLLLTRVIHALYF